MRLFLFASALLVSTACFEESESNGFVGDDDALHLGDLDLVDDMGPDGVQAPWYEPDLAPDVSVARDDGMWDGDFDPTAPTFMRFFVSLSPDPFDETGRIWVGTERNSIENADGAVGCAIEWNMTGAHAGVPDAACADCEQDVAMTCADAQFVDGGFCNRYYSSAYQAATQQWYADFRVDYVRDDGVEVGTVWSRSTREGAKWREFVGGFRDGDHLYWDELKAR